MQGVRAKRPCAVCGGINNNLLEPRFLYVVCEDHYNTPPVDVPIEGSAFYDEQG